MTFYFKQTGRGKKSMKQKTNLKQLFFVATILPLGHQIKMVLFLALQLHKCKEPN